MYIPPRQEARRSMEQRIPRGEQVFRSHIFWRLLIGIFGAAGAVLLLFSFTVHFIIAKTTYWQLAKIREHTRETILRENLFVMRQAIDNFTLDRNVAPQSLDDLQQANYLKSIPKDPLTHSPDWGTDTCDTIMSPDQTTTGICDVHSTAPGSSPFDGTAYTSW